MTKWLTGFPMPPSINDQLMPKGNRLIKTPGARVHDSRASFWAMKNARAISEVRASFLPHVSSGMGLRVDAYFAFEERRLLTKGLKAESWIKVLDANNRLKSALDGLSDALEIDDKYFITGLCEKVTCKLSADEMVLFKITLAPLRSLEQIRSEMTQIS